jgi:hypothetical protein
LVQVLIGGAAVWLTPLTHHLEIDDWVAVIGYQGQRRGEVKVKLVPELLGGDGVEIDEYVLLEKGLLAYHGATLKLEISVVDVRGLPESLNNALVRSLLRSSSASACARYSCFPSRASSARVRRTRALTQCSRGALPSPPPSLQVGRVKFDNETARVGTPCGAAAAGIPYTCEVQVTPKLIEYIEEHALEVEIFGTPRSHAGMAPPRLLSPTAAGSGAGTPVLPRVDSFSPTVGGGGAAEAQLRADLVAMQREIIELQRQRANTFQLVLKEGIIVKKHPVRVAAPFDCSTAPYARPLSLSLSLSLTFSLLLLCCTPLEQRSGKPRTRVLWLVDNKLACSDQKSATPADDKCVALSEVEAITSGATSVVFKKTMAMKKYTYNGNTCMTIEGAHGSRSLDLEFGSTEARDWVHHALTELLESG